MQRVEAGGRGDIGAGLWGGVGLGGYRCSAEAGHVPLTSSFFFMHSIRMMNRCWACVRL